MLDGHIIMACPVLSAFTLSALIRRHTLSVVFLLATIADQSCNAFLPLHAQGLGRDFALALSSSMAAALPSAVFWLMVAAAQLTTAWWDRGRDHRHLTAGALALSCLALAGCSQATSLETLVLWRGLGGFATGMVMMLVQDGMLRAAGAETRTRASGGYLGVFFAGTILGTLGGGMAADWGGPSMALRAAAAVAAVAGLLACAVPSYREIRGGGAEMPLAALAKPSLLALLLVGAMPSRLLISGFLYYLVPLALHDSGADSASIARVLILYALIMAVMAQPWARLADHWRRPRLFALAGLGLSALALAVAPLSRWAGLDALPALALAVGVLGVAQSIGMAPQVTILFQIAAPEMDRFGRTPVLGLFRVCERLGLFAGPVLAGWLAGWGPGTALAGLGVLSVSSLAVLSAIFFHDRSPPHERAAFPG